MLNFCQIWSQCLRSKCFPSVTGHHPNSLAKDLLPEPELPLEVLDRPKREDRLLQRLDPERQTGIVLARRLLLSAVLLDGDPPELREKKFSDGRSGWTSFFTFKSYPTFHHSISQLNVPH